MSKSRCNKNDVPWQILIPEFMHCEYKSHSLLSKSLQRPLVTCRRKTKIAWVRYSWIWCEVVKRNFSLKLKKETMYVKNLLVRHTTNNLHPQERIYDLDYDLIRAGKKSKFIASRKWWGYSIFREFQIRQNANLSKYFLIRSINFIYIDKRIIRWRGS